MLLTAVLVLLQENVATAAITLEQLIQQRETATYRPRNLIYNNDGADVIYSDDHTPAGLLAVRTNGVAGTQVDTINYCSRSSGFGLFTHNTQVGEIFTSTGGRYYNNMTQDLIDQGTDVVDVMVDFAHDNDIELFWSMRMNDTHDAHSESAIYAFPQLKLDHPEWMMGSNGVAPAYGAWTAIDYGVQEVRDLALAYFTEVCQNYDVDGIELDFFRHPYFFRSHTTGGTATDTDRAQMTQLVRDIRTMTEQVGMQREKPILVSIRVPDSMELASDIGLDVNQWLTEDLVDTMSVSGYFRAEHWQESVALGHQYDVPVYACLSDSRMGGSAGTLRKSKESYWARASGAWQEGVDGIYMFNYFSDSSELWDVVGSPDTLAGKTKVYTTGARGVESMTSALSGGIGYLEREVVSPERTASLAPGQARTYKLSVGDNFSEPGLDGRVRLRLQMANLSDVGDMQVRINNQILSGGTVSGGFVDYLIDPTLVNQGWNDFMLGLNPSTAQSATIQDLQLWVTYRPDTPPDPIVWETFVVGNPADASLGEYSQGNLVGAAPTLGLFNGPWAKASGTVDGVFQVVASGLTHENVEAEGGAVKFQHNATLAETHSVKREFSQDALSNDDDVIYVTGMMSFDENFNTSFGSQALTGLLNAEEGDPDVPWTIGLQWGFQGNGAGGVDAVLRARDNNSPDYSVETVVLASNIDPGTHLFAMKVQIDPGGDASDQISVWLDPADVWSELEAGSPTLSDTFACWLIPYTDPDRPVDTLLFSVTAAGADAAVMFDEIRLGRAWSDLFLSPEAVPTIPGDANSDGVVDAADAAALAANWQTTTGATWAQGDFTGDGRVDEADATLLAANWQQTVGGASATVPEPSMLVLLALSSIGLLLGRQHRV